MLGRRRARPASSSNGCTPRGCSKAACRIAGRYSRTGCTCATRNGAEVEKHDAYYFAPQLTDFDFYLFGEGNHYSIYYKLGAHPGELDGLPGTRFAVWAPNAERVSVVGPFNFWDGRKHAMQVRGGSGIWELFIPDVGPGRASTSTRSARGPGSTILKADPYGFAMELRPGNASVVASLDGFEWHDEAWIAARAATNHTPAPDQHLRSASRQLASRLRPHAAVPQLARTRRRADSVRQGRRATRTSS